MRILGIITNIFVLIFIYGTCAVCGMGLLLLAVYMTKEFLLDVISWPKEFYDKIYNGEMEDDENVKERR